MKPLHSLCLLCLTGLIVWGCFREDEVSIDLPEEPPVLVVESYLQPGAFYRVSLTRSQPYFELPNDIEALRNVLVPDARVMITYQGQTDTLTYRPLLDPESNIPIPDPDRYFPLGEYRADRRVPADYTSPFYLRIEHGDKVITAQTRIQIPVPIDSLYALRNEAGEYTLRTVWTDPNPGATNFYRFVADDGRPDTTTEYSLSDRVLTSDQQATGTGYNYEDGDTVDVRLYHVSEAFYNFDRSIGRSISGNYNPFSEPGTIQSTVQGDGIGIFTGFSVDERRIILED